MASNIESSATSDSENDSEDTKSTGHGNDVYNIEKIVDMRNRKKEGVRFRVRWEGYGPDKDTWEPKKNLFGSECKQMLEAFMANRKAEQSRSRKNSKKSNLRKSQAAPSNEKLPSTPSSERSDGAQEVSREQESENGPDQEIVEKKDQVKKEEVASPKSLDGPRTQLLNAVLKYDYDEVNRLLEIEPSMLTKESLLGLTLLRICGKRQDNSDGDQCRIIELLIQYGASMDDPDATNTTVLMYLCKKGSLCCFKTFMKYRPHLDSEDNVGETALFAAVRRKNPRMIEWLMKNGACCTRKNKRGQTIIDIIDENIRSDPDSIDFLEGAKTCIQNFTEKMESRFKRRVLDACGQSVELLRPVSDVRWSSCGDIEHGCNQLEFNLENSPINEDSMLLLFGFKLRMKANYRFEITVGSNETEKSMIQNVYFVNKKDGEIGRGTILQKCDDVSETTSPKVVFALRTVFKNNRILIKPVNPIKHGEAVIFQIYAVKLLPNCRESVPGIPVTVQVNFDDLKIGAM